LQVLQRLRKATYPDSKNFPNRLLRLLVRRRQAIYRGCDNTSKVRITFSSQRNDDHSSKSISFFLRHAPTAKTPHSRSQEKRTAVYRHTGGERTILWSIGPCHQPCKADGKTAFCQNLISVFWKVAKILCFSATFLIHPCTFMSCLELMLWTVDQLAKPLYKLPNGSQRLTPAHP